MRILITGSRYWHCRRAMITMMHRMIEKHGAADLVFVHGACPNGADKAMETVCNDFVVRQEPHPADWDKHGTPAGPIRNSEMVKLGADLCLVFSQDLKNSPGTKDCARKAIAAGIPTWLIDNDDAKPTKLKANDPRLEKIAS